MRLKPLLEYSASNGGSVCVTQSSFAKAELEFRTRMIVKIIKNKTDKVLLLKRYMDLLSDRYKQGTTKLLYTPHDGWVIHCFMLHV